MLACCFLSLIPVNPQSTKIWRRELIFYSTKRASDEHLHQFWAFSGAGGGGKLNRLLPAGCTVKTYFSRTHNNTTYAGYQINEKKNTKTPQLLLPGRIDRQNGRPGDLMTKLETTGKTGRVGKYKSTHSH